jgi:ribosomal protein L21E
MPEYAPGDRVEVDISAGILPGTNPEPDWRTGVVVERTSAGRYRIRLDDPIAGQTAEKEAAPEHVRPAT